MVTQADKVPVTRSDRTKVWQEFLQAWQAHQAAQGKPLADTQRVEADGYFGPVTQKATLAFQTQFQGRQEIEQEAGKVGGKTLEKALEVLQVLKPERQTPLKPLDGSGLLQQLEEMQPVIEAGDELRREKFVIGPDRQRDLSECRRYFMLPLLELADSERHPEGTHEKLKARILKWVEEKLVDTNKPQQEINVVVLSHGWHRNFYGAISAYDRLSSRFALLLNRGRLHGGNRLAAQEFANHTLFLNLHWHSDPGENQFVDDLGRRNKASFLEKARATFEIGAGVTAKKKIQFVNDFEEMFALFSDMAAPDTSAVSDVKLAERAQESGLIGRLRDDYELRDAPDASLPEKVAAVWACYHEALNHEVLDDQGESPGRFMSFGRTVKTLAEFVLNALGIGALLMPLVPGIREAVIRSGKQGWLWLLTYIQGRIKERLPTLPEWLYAGLSSLGSLLTLAIGLILLACLVSGVCFAARWLIEKWRTPSQKESVFQRFPLWALILWGILQVPAALPALGFLLITYFFGGLTRIGNSLTPFGLFDGRLGGRNEDPEAVMQKTQGTTFTEKKDRILLWWRYRSLRWLLANLGVQPVFLVKALYPLGSRFCSLPIALERQAAIWEMEFKGVMAGTEAGKFLANLLTEAHDTLAKKNLAVTFRLRFAGHSFGALVVANAARYLAHYINNQKKANKDVPFAIHALCTVQGALASAWFEQEKILRGHVESAIAAIYSRYDTANGNIYPLANNARLVMGSVGMYGGEEFTFESFGKEGEFAMLVKPPDLTPKPDTVTPTRPRCLNLDASRIIYNGSPLAGGGHGDIFKDDAVNLIWAATTLEENPPP